MIEPHYVSFNTAKLLKEKGFNESVNGLFFDGEFKDISPKKASNTDFASTRYNSAPEQWQVVEWLRINYGIQVFLDYTYYDGFHYGCKYVRSNGGWGEFWKIQNDDSLVDGCDTSQEAYSAAFDYILTNLI